jgi:signal transduction histidine kinase
MADRSKVKFLQDNKQVVYSIALMIFIPGIVILNTWIFSIFFKDTIDLSLQDKAIGIGETINAGLADKLNSPEAIQSFADNYKGMATSTKSLDVFYRKDAGFKLIASLDKGQVGRLENSTAYAIAWNNNWPTAQKIAGDYWLVVMPLKDLQGQKQALLSMELSADVISTLLLVVLVRSYFILIITVALIILLLFANSHLFEYSILYNKIKEIDAMKNDFISMASHELRTPVMAIKGFASLIMEERKKNPASEEIIGYLSIINISADRLNLLVEDLLNVSRIEQGRLEMDMQKIDAWPIIKETAAELKVQSDAKKIILACALEAGANSTVMVDANRFKQVLINIIGNAIKYTPAGKVEILVKNGKDKNLLVLVKDTGIGMLAKERERLFEKFYRIRKKETDEIIGTGLGLWISKQIVELMGGAISVDSIENVGSQFTIDLPLAE